MYVYVAKTKNVMDKWTLRVFRRKADATRWVKQAQDDMYRQLQYMESHDTYDEYCGFGITMQADPDVKHKREQVTVCGGDKTIYYVTPYDNKGTQYYKNCAGYVKRIAVE